MGEIVSDLLDNHETNQADLAKKLGWLEPAVTKLLKKRNWNMFELKEVGNAINEDLFDLCKPAPKEPMLPASEVADALKEKKIWEDKYNKLKTDYDLLKAKHEGALEAMEAMKK